MSATNALPELKPGCFKPLETDIAVCAMAPECRFVPKEGEEIVYRRGACTRAFKQSELPSHLGSDDHRKMTDGNIPVLR